MEGRGQSTTVGPFALSNFVRYAAASGDFNPVHHDADLARSLGNPGVFAMGMLPGALLLEYAAHVLSPLCIVHASLRFEDRVWVGEQLVLTVILGETGVDGSVALTAMATSNAGVCKVRLTGRALPTGSAMSFNASQ